MLVRMIYYLNGIDEVKLESLYDNVQTFIENNQVTVDDQEVEVDTSELETIETPKQKKI